ncbi:unnamed protein product [Peniophora sp. CBMAI 1063]|nr:unnamed protein product [Peniophora sp. CBMAI 1063]
MELSAGFATDIDMLKTLLEYWEGRLADISLTLLSAFPALEVQSRPVLALRSEFDVMLALYGHLRLDGHMPLPPAHAFTSQLMRALDDPTGTLLRDMRNFRPLPPRTGSESRLAASIFPKWYTNPEIMSPDWKPFLLGRHICDFYVSMMTSSPKTPLLIPPLTDAPGPSAQDARAGRARTAAEFRGKMENISEDLVKIEKEVSTILLEAQSLWEEDFRLHRETHDQWEAIGSP